MGTPRPWRVFARDLAPAHVGPRFSFNDEETAHDRAKALVGKYAEVIVYLSGFPTSRTVYRHDREQPYVERFDRTAGRWKEES